MPHQHFRLLAMDIDGTLLDSQGHLRESTIEAVHRAGKAGIRPVLCTGRRFRGAYPIADRLGIDSPVICNSGALVKASQGERTLWRADLSAELVTEILDIFQIREERAVSFTDHPLHDFDFFVSEFHSGRSHFDDYVSKNHLHAKIDPEWMTRTDLDHYHICAIGTRSAMVELEEAILERSSGLVQTFVQKSPSYAGTMCEVLRHDANKWTALLQVARSWGIHASEICAVGDDMNDIPMLRGAGLGVAMGHANAMVLAAADLVTGSDREDGVALLIDNVLLA